jgi:hypothetical protein
MPVVTTGQLFVERPLATADEKKSDERSERRSDEPRRRRCPTTIGERSK